MKTDNDLQNKYLEELFKEVSLEKPSLNFTENLMKKIEKEAVKQEQKIKWLTVGQIAAGVTGILLTPVLTIYFCRRFIPDFAFTFPNIQMSFDPMIFSIGFSVLLLLIADTLLRKHIHSKRDE